MADKQRAIRGATSVSKKRKGKVTASKKNEESYTALDTFPLHILLTLATTVVIIYDS